MRSYASAELTHLQARTGVRPRLLVWIVARNRTTGLAEGQGFWNGDQDQSFTIGGVPRTYLGAGGLLGMDDITWEVGLNVRRISLWLATAAPEVVAAVQGYDLRLAPIEVHRVLTDPVSHVPVADPHRLWKGWIDEAPSVIPARGLSGGRITVVAASAALALTRGLPLRWSDEAMRRRGGDDRLFRYADVSGKVPVYWGERKFTPTPPAETVPEPAPGKKGGDQ